MVSDRGTFVCGHTHGNILTPSFNVINNVTFRPITNQHVWYINFYNDYLEIHTRDDF